MQVKKFYQVSEPGWYWYRTNPKTPWSVARVDRWKKDPYNPGYKVFQIDSGFGSKRSSAEYPHFELAGPIQQPSA